MNHWRRALVFQGMCGANPCIDPSECDRFAVAFGNPAWSIEMENALHSIVGDADDEVEPIESDVDDF